MVLGLLNQLMIVGELWTAGASHAGDSFSLSLGRRGATGFPLLTSWDSVAGLGRAPIPGNISGRRLTYRSLIPKLRVCGVLNVLSAQSAHYAHPTQHILEFAWLVTLVRD